MAMAKIKRASISRNSLSSSSTSVSDESSASASTTSKKLVLRIKTSRFSGRKECENTITRVEIEGKHSPRKRSSKAVSKRKPTKTQKKVDANKPKKPPTAFFYFLEDFRKGYQEENPQVKSMRDIGKACGEKWKIMTYEEKVKYYDIATEKRADFDRAMTEYLKRKESGEDAIAEDTESEFDGE